MKGLIVALLLFRFVVVEAQQHQVLMLDTLHAFPGKTKPAEKDLSAQVRVSATPDSLFFSVDVTDDAIISGSGNDKGDHIEIWLGFPQSDFSDYLVSENKKRSFIFRNSSETGDNADLEKFLKNGDYPTGKLKNETTGKISDPEVPEGKDLRKDYVFFGLTRFTFHPDNRPAKHLDREKYRLLEKELGFKIDDLSANAVYSSEKTASGYRMKIAMHTQCIGFARASLTNEIRFAVDVMDVDSAEETQDQISSTPNRFYGRSNYFNQAELPFYLNVTTNVPDSTIRQLGLQVNVARSGNEWKSFGYGAGAIVYGSEKVSEAGFVEYLFYPIAMSYSHSGNPAEVKFERVDQVYDDITPFPQHDIYFLIDTFSTPYSSKSYMYVKEVPNDFVNTVFSLPDGTPALVLYDYEAADPLGWGIYGQMADEFVYIQKLDGQGGKSLYSGGHRIEIMGQAGFGQTDTYNMKDVKSVNYRWLKKGESFEITVHRNKSNTEVVVFEIGNDYKFYRKK